jgi:hypothetical protein
MSTAYYDGNAIFGLAVKVQHVPKASAAQVNAFFGVTGTQSVYGGGRGRTFMVSGVLVAADLSALDAAESTLLSYDDGLARVLTDTWGRNWPDVVFTGEYQPDPMGPRPLADGSGVGLPYRCTFRGNT